MKMIDVVQLTRDAIANTMGADYLPTVEESHNSDLKALQSFNLVDVGEEVTSESNISNFMTGLVSLIGRHIIDNRIFTNLSRFKHIFSNILLC